MAEIVFSIAMALKSTEPSFEFEHEDSFALIKSNSFCTLA
jgi:hypothetical protein